MKTRNEYEDKVFKDKVYDDAKNNDFDPPNKTSVGTDIVNGFTGIYDNRYIENHEYRQEFDKATEALKKT